MTRMRIVIAIVGAVLAAGLIGWLFHIVEGSRGWSGGSPVLAAVIVGGVLVTGLLGGALMWLAFYSSRKGFDDDAAHYDDK